MITYQPEGPDTEAVTVDFTPPFKRVNLYDGLEEKLGVQLPSPETLDTAEANQFFIKLATDRGVECPEPKTTARLLDKVCYLHIRQYRVDKLPNVLAYFPSSYHFF